MTVFVCLLFQGILPLHSSLVVLPCFSPAHSKTTTMSIIQDKLGNEFLRNGGMDPNFTPGMLMFSHLPPVTSFTRLTSQSVMGELPQEMILKKERDSPPDHQINTAANTGGFLHSMGIKQERLSELDYRMPLYGGGGGLGVNCAGVGAGKSSTDMPDMSFGNHHQNHQNMLLHDLSHSNVRSLGEPVSWNCDFAYSNYSHGLQPIYLIFACPQMLGRSGKEPKEPSGRRGRRSNGDGQGGKARRKRNDAAKVNHFTSHQTQHPEDSPFTLNKCGARLTNIFTRKHAAMPSIPIFIE